MPQLDDDVLPLKVETRVAGSVLVVDVQGELDLTTAPTLTARIDDLRRTRGSRVLVDVSSLEFCDSTGLRALIGAAKEVRAAGGRLAMCAGSGAVARLIDIVGAREWLEVHQDADAALAALTRR